MKKYIVLKKEVEGYYSTLQPGEEFHPNEPDQGFNPDGTFTVCQGFGVYLTFELDEFETITKTEESL